MIYEFEEYSKTKMSTGTLCSHLNAFTLYSPLIVLCNVKHHLTGSKGEQRGNSSVLLFCVRYSQLLFFSYFLRLNHYLGNVHIIMLVRFKLVEEREKWCIVKKCVALRKKSSFGLTNKNIPGKMAFALFCLNV